MPLLSNQSKKTIYISPVASVGKFVSRVTNEDEYHEPDVFQRVLVKTGVTVHERRYDTISGHIIDFDVVNPRDPNYDSQYRVLIVSDDEPDKEGALVVGVNSSLGRQLVNQLLSLTAEDLLNPVTFTFRSIEKDGQRRGYINLFYGRKIMRTTAVPRKYSIDEIPPPTERKNKTKGGVVEYDYSAANEFFFDKVEEIRENIAEALSRTDRGVEQKHAGHEEDFLPEHAEPDFDPAELDQPLKPEPPRVPPPHTRAAAAGRERSRYAQSHVKEDDIPF